jgi:hypothetical protein
VQGAGRSGSRAAGVEEGKLKGLSAMETVRPSKRRRCCDTYEARARALELRSASGGAHY